MKIKLVVVIVTLALGSCSTKTQQKESPGNASEEHLKLPAIFEVNNFSISMNEEFTELYTTSVDAHGDMTILWAQKKNELWGLLKPISFSDHEYNDIDPFLSRDGQKLYFISNRPNEMFENDDAIWVSSREQDGWGTPKLLSKNLNFEGNEGFPSVANNGNIYFPMVINDNRDIYVSHLINDEYQTPVPLSDAINSTAADSNPAISGDEQFLVFYSAREGGFGETDLYFSRKENNKWTPAINLGEEVNSKHIEYCPYITHDNKHLLFTRWNRENNIRYLVQFRLDTFINNL